jgi:two-component system CitB family sensor kinase
VANEREIDLTITPASHLDVRPDEAQNLLSILGNLIDNALDAVADQPPPRTVTVDLDDDHDLLIVVADNGPGIPRYSLDDIFVDGYSTKSPRGQSRRGLGLALVQRLVHRVGGTVTVVSNEGARFEVRLPARGYASDGARWLTPVEAWPQ